MSKIYNAEVGGAWVTMLNIYLGMLARCHKPQSPVYGRYGGRGITVCERWRLSFQHFVDDMGLPPPKLTLERIDNDKGYEPGNCKWATRQEQALNKTHKVGEHGRGVYKTHCGFGARFKRDGRQMYLGHYRTWEEATAARQRAEREYEQNKTGATIG